MENPKKPSLATRFRNFILGKAIDPSQENIFHNLSLIAFFAWVGLGADGLSSSSYGPEEAFLALGNHPYLGIIVAIATAVTVLIISASYTQLIELFPAGGGGYLVASKLLSPSAGMISGCALIIDYVLTIAISISSGADAIFSFLPAAWAPYKFETAMIVLGLLTLLNMRGVKESIMPLVPVFLVFIFTHYFAIVYAFAVHTPEIPSLYSSTVADTAATHSEIGLWGLLFLVLKAYSMGAGTYTGIEAVSNGMGILREPKVQTGRRTMAYMAISLATMVFGLMVAYLLYEVHHVPGKTLNAVLFESLSAGWGRGGEIFVLVTLASEAAILFVAAQAGFLGGPRVLANMALDHWFPSQFALLSDRLVTKNGILLMGIAALATLLATGGSVKLLVVLYSITVFITFVLSQLGMVLYWWKNRSTLSVWKRKIAVNGIGLLLCVFILITMIFLKFNSGGWVTLLVTGGLAVLAYAIRSHYRKVGTLLKRMDNLVQAARTSSLTPPPRALGKEIPLPDPKAKTAVLMVNGFNGLGLHSLFAIIRLFSGVFKNYVFVQVGLVDAGNFKGKDELDHLQSHVRKELDLYVEFMHRHGHAAEGMMSISHDAVEGSTDIAPEILERYPQAVFFMGQLVFPEDTFISRVLHNNLVFAVQRRLYHRGIPFIILPVRIRAPEAS